MISRPHGLPPHFYVQIARNPAANHRAYWAAWVRQGALKRRGPSDLDVGCWWTRGVWGVQEGVPGATPNLPEVPPGGRGVIGG